MSILSTSAILPRNLPHFIPLKLPKSALIPQPVKIGPYGIDKSPPIKPVESSSRSQKYEACDFVENNVPHGPLTRG